MKLVAEVDADNSVNNFYRAIYIYLKKPQVVNRKLSCSSNIVFLKLNLKSWENKSKSDLIKILSESSCDSPERVIDVVSSLAIECTQVNLEELEEFDESKDGIYLSVDRMLPRNIQKFQTCVLATLIGTKLWDKDNLYLY